MTVSATYKSRSIGTNLTAGSANIIYECPANWTSHVVLLFVTNATGGNKNLTIEWYDTSTSTWYFILGGYILSSYGYLQLSDSYLVLNGGDRLRITPEAGSTMSATVTVEEYFDPANRA